MSETKELKKQLHVVKNDLRLEKEKNQKLEKRLKEVEDILSFIMHEMAQALHISAIFINGVIQGVFNYRDASINETLKSILARLEYALETIKAVKEPACSNFLQDEICHDYCDLRLDVLDYILIDIFEEMIKKNDIHIDNALGSIPVGKIRFQKNILSVLRIVFNNLISNAIKYGGHGCTIAIGYEKDSSGYTFNVYNSGQPIATDFLDKLFNKGERENAQDVPGSGIGLYHVKCLLEKMGGNIRYETTPDGKPNFLIWLPLNIFD